MSANTTLPESLLEAVPEALVGMDQAGVVRFVNHQTESLFGYDREDLIGQPIQTLVPQYLWEVYSEHEEEYFSDPRARSMGLDLQLIGRPQDGAEFPVNVNLAPIDTGDVLLVITDVREVTKHEQALANSELLASIVKNSNDAIITKTLDGIVTFWNPAAERMYGYSSEEMIGTSIDQLSPQVGPARSPPSWPGSGPTTRSSTTRPYGSERTERSSRSCSPSPRYTTRTA